MISHFSVVVPTLYHIVYVQIFKVIIKFHKNFTLQTRHMPAAGQYMFGAFACDVCVI